MGPGKKQVKRFTFQANLLHVMVMVLLVVAAVCPGNAVVGVVDGVVVDDVVDGDGVVDGVAVG